MNPNIVLIIFTTTKSVLIIFNKRIGLLLLQLNHTTFILLKAGLI